jgi:hypothetical protein
MATRAAARSLAQEPSVRERPEEAWDGNDREGKYSNYFKVGYTQLEFLLDFGQAYEGTRALCQTRIVTSPPYAKALADLLNKTVSEYEKAHGTILPIPLPQMPED